jgi:hypothetical protein
VAKVVVTKLLRKSAREIAGKGISVQRRRVRDEDGDIRIVWALDGGSGTFDADLTYVFGRNVAKARRENKEVTGATDFVPAKH